MTKPTIQWAAGIIDGEGSIGIRHRLRGDRPGKRWEITLSASNTDYRMALGLKRLFGLGTLQMNPARGRKRKSLEWKAHGRQAVQVLVATLPFLVLKPEQAELAIELGQTMRGPGRLRNRAVSPEMTARREVLRTRLQVLKKEPPLQEEVS